MAVLLISIATNKTAHLEVCIGSSEEQFAFYEVDFISTALFSSEAHSGCCALWGCIMATDDQRVSPQVVIEAEHHRVT